MEREYLLDLPVDTGNIDEVLDWIARKVVKKNNKPAHIITAYSEFFVRARRDKKFAKIWKEADLITVDGVGVFWALDYKKNGLLSAIGKTLSGKLSGVVTGVELFRRLSKGNYRIFLLGGFGDTVDLLADKLKEENKGLDFDFDRGAQTEKEMVGKENDALVDRVNKFDADILFVAYGPGRQEKWIYENKKRLKTPVIIGVGGTFDEVLGRFPKAPRWMEERGLKWLQRLAADPSRWRRIIKAVIIFPWLVFRNKVVL
jgi:N-acetylglucosaminyldiphosphoundecaprenol N-acetyl-beta-D-mannosaminyltransferase